MNRIYHRYEIWEDYKAGMWRVARGEERESLIEKAIAFTGNHIEYGKYMLKVAREWPISCEQNLTDTLQNRKAWIGHAACCMAIGCPEDITRQAWKCLTEKQQCDANDQAQNAIEIWELDHEEKNRTSHQVMDVQGVFCWHSI